MDGDVVLEVYRYVISFIAWLILLEGVGWMRGYWRSLVRNQASLKDNFLGAPLLAFWLLHLGFFVITVELAISNLYSAFKGFPFDPISVLFLPGCLLVLWGIHETRPFLLRVHDQVNGEE